MYIEDSDATFINSTFRNNFARNGGSIYVKGDSTIILNNVTIESSTSIVNGGFLFVEEPTDNV